MKLLIRVLLAGILISVVALIVFLLRGPREKETWATLTAALAVVAAVISVWPSLRVLEIQEDASRPSPTPYFDMTSRYQLIQLRVKNIGAGVAYDVHLKWDGKRPQNESGEELSALDSIPVLMPHDSVSVLVGRPFQLFQKYPTMRFEGTVEFKDVTGKHLRQRFLCCPDGSRASLVHDDELVKTLFELQRIPEYLEAIHKTVDKLAKSDRF